MKAEVQKILKLYEELEAAGETATLTFSTSGDKSIVKLQLQPPTLLTSSPSSQSCSNTSFWQASPPSWRKSKSLPKSAGSCPPSFLGWGSYPLAYAVFLHHHLNLGGVKSQLWRGWMCRPSPPSIWTALHHLPHHDHHHQDSPLWVCGFPYATPTATPHHCLDYGLCY